MKAENPPPPPTSGRKLRLLVVAAVLCVGLYPLVALPLSRGRAWTGALPYTEGDEMPYAAHVTALAAGRPRRSYPYSGRDDRPGDPQPETFFSIQFVPAYALALPVRALGLDVTHAFALLSVLVCVLAPLVLFRLITSVTGDERLAAAGALVVLCMATVPTRYGPLNYVLGKSPILLGYPPFLRRHVPALAFPLFFGYCALVWRALRDGRPSARRALPAALAFAVLVYTYFFLWTAVAAWLACLALVWLVARPAGWRADLKVFGTVAAGAALALAPYFVLISRRAASLDSSHLLTETRAPDLLRLPELFGLLVLAALALASRRGLAPFRHRATLFAASFALMPLAVFNQQIVTGRSLQPIHYEMYIANFCALLSAALAFGLARPWRLVPARLYPERLYARALAAVAVLAFAWGLAGSVRSTRGRQHLFEAQNSSRPALLRLAALARETGPPPEGDTRPLVFAPDPTVADLLPTVAGWPPLWAPHTFVFAGDSMAEERERAALFLYYTGVRFDGVDETNYRRLDPRRRSILFNLISPTRANPYVDPNWTPIRPDEVRRALDAYNAYVSTFTRERAALSPVSHLLARRQSGADLSHFDRFYERDAGEPYGDFIIHRVRLRP